MFAGRSGATVGTSRGLIRPEVQLGVPLTHEQPSTTGYSSASFRRSIARSNSPASSLASASVFNSMTISSSHRPLGWSGPGTGGGPLRYTIAPCGWDLPEPADREQHLHRISDVGAERRQRRSQLRDQLSKAGRSRGAIGSGSRPVYGRSVRSPMQTAVRGIAVVGGWLAVASTVATASATASSVNLAHGQLAGYSWRLTVSSRTLGAQRVPALCASFLAGGSGFPACIAPAIGRGERRSLR
jgi:hypothetical protein